MITCSHIRISEWPNNKVIIDSDFIIYTSTMVNKYFIYIPPITSLISSKCVAATAACPNAAVNDSSHVTADVSGFVVEVVIVVAVVVGDVPC
ncbi:hypothetical protein DERF_001884 [Dermatophagoides farinae]|uniref:Uncharacterized protein n=1 Tax=Dermatophagoides farinae TaxID=6954 RepID=A0A922ID70_DERFA|nr:hypothetical protein DERF_001884 [Dermatophagoides farinae]